MMVNGQPLEALYKIPEKLRDQWFDRLSCAADISEEWQLSIIFDAIDRCKAALEAASDDNEEMNAQSGIDFYAHLAGEIAGWRMSELPSRQRIQKWLLDGHSVFIRGKKVSVSARGERVESA